MEVILLEKIRNLGGLGDVVRVKPGFGRNFLIPQKKAIQASEANKKVFESRRAELLAKEDSLLAAAKTRAEQLAALAVAIEAQATDEGKLYGSVGPAEIAEAITAAGVEIEKREVSMPTGPIHELGEHSVEIQLHSDVAIAIGINISEAKKH
jgi:large subunit ribosomal protein L9